MLFLGIDDRKAGRREVSMSQELSRRNFVAKAAAVAAAPAVLPALGQNNKVNMGVIGTGGRGYYLLQRAYAGNKANVNVTGVCDTFSVNLARGKDLVTTSQAPRRRPMWITGNCSRTRRSTQ